MRTKDGESKYVRLAEEIRRRIREGELQVSDRLPTFSEMRAEFGAMPTTVDRVYDMLDREGLVKREKGRGVFVAEKIRRPPTGVLGVYNMSDAKNSYSDQLLSGIQEVARRANREILLLNDNSTARWEKVDGVLDCNTGEHIEPISGAKLPMRRLPPGIPYVSLLAPVKGESSIVSNEMEATYEATQFLISQGHRRIAFLGATHTRWARRRATAYREALQEAGITPRDEWMKTLRTRKHGSYRESGWNTMTRWLRRDWEALGCTAIIVQNDDGAIGVMRALSEAGLRVPHDVSVVGFDGTEIGEWYQPSITSVALPLREIGMRGTELLLRKIAGEEIEPMTLELPAQLVVRQSTAPR